MAENVPNSLQFQRHVRGFTLSVTNYERVAEVYAFERIEDLAQWLIDQYAEPEIQPADEWGPAFHGSKEIGKVLKGENGDMCSRFVGWYGQLFLRDFNLPEMFYRLPAGHWFYQHHLFKEANP